MKRKVYRAAETYFVPWNLLQSFFVCIRYYLECPFLWPTVSQKEIYLNTRLSYYLLKVVLRRYIDSSELPFAEPIEPPNSLIFSHKPKNMAVKIGESVDMNCFFKLNTTNPQVLPSWLFGHQIIASGFNRTDDRYTFIGDPRVGNYSLKINETTERDGGVYTCRLQEYVHVEGGDSYMKEEPGMADLIIIGNHSQIASVIQLE